MGKIYFDYNSTAPILPKVEDVILNMMQLPLNPSSQHYYGQFAKKIIEETRNTVKQSINASKNYDLIFTSGGTEANNIIMNNNFVHIISAIEHPSILNSAQNPITIPVDTDGRLNTNILEHHLMSNAGKDILISVMLANNETGIMQDIKLITSIAHKYGAVIHTDAVQAYGRCIIDVDDLDVDALTLSAHKVGGGCGVGALIFKNNINIKPIFYGGNQERGYRSGTENVAAISGFGHFASEIKTNIDSMHKIKLLRDLFEYKMKNTIQDVIICSVGAPRIPNTSMLIIPGFLSEMQVIYFDMHGIAVSSGSACSSGKVDSSHVLHAMGFTKELSKCAIRVSMGLNNTDADVDVIVNLWKLLCT